MKSKTKRMNTKDPAGWYFNERATSHYVSSFEGELVPMSRCGKRSDIGWLITPMASSGPAHKCGRCELLLAKDKLRETAGKQQQELDQGEFGPASTPPPEAKEQTVSLFMQVMGEATPVAYVPTPDLEEVIRLLEQHLPSEIAQLSRSVINAACKSLRTYIVEAEKRAELPSSSTWTYSKPEGKKKG